MSGSSDTQPVPPVRSREAPELLDWLPGRLKRDHCAPQWKHDVGGKVRKRELGL